MIRNKKYLPVALSAGLFLAANSVYAKNDNFRFAIPDGYTVVKHHIDPETKGGFVELAPVSEQPLKNRILRLQSYPAVSYPKEIKTLGMKKSRELLNKIIGSQLKNKCAKHSVNSGKIRKRNGGVRINWWTSCQMSDGSNTHEFERGRLFLSDTGAYFISHINRADNDKHQFSRNEIKWFDRYLHNSGLCETGKNCGEEGALVQEIFKQK